MAFALAYYYHYAVEESDLEENRSGPRTPITHQSPVQG